MRPHSKRYRQSREKVDRNRRYSVVEAVALLKQMPPSKFDQTVELSIHLRIDPKKTDQTVRGAVALPKGIGRSRKVVVFADGAEAAAAKAAGADEVGAEDLVQKVEKGWTDFDVAITLPRMMRHVGKLGKVLGPQGKMPSPKAGTVTDDVATAVREFKGGKVEFRTDAGGNVAVPVGKVSFPDADLKANIEAFLDHIQASRPAGVKGGFVATAGLSATMSPGIPLTVSA